MDKRTTALLYGGRSGEHEVSLQSATSVMRAFDLTRNELILIGIDTEGRWYLQPEDLVDRARDGQEELTVVTEGRPRVLVEPGCGLRTNERPLDIDVVFPVLHGTFGEDGTLQGALEQARIPYVGADVCGSAAAFDKEIAKRLWMEARIPVIPFFTETIPADGPNSAFRDHVTARIRNEIGFPAFIKPARCGSSVGVRRVARPEDVPQALEAASAYDMKIVAEMSISGREIECSVVGNEHVQSYALGEIIPTHDFYDYEAKYVDPEGAGLSIPADLTSEQTQRIRTLAEQAYRACNCSGFARVDFFLVEGEHNGTAATDSRRLEAPGNGDGPGTDAERSRSADTIYVNEINTIPGFTRISMFPKLCEHYGLPYGRLIEQLIELAEARHGRTEQLSYTYRTGPESTT